jgi:hypothetical protein
MINSLYVQGFCWKYARTGVNAHAIFTKAAQAA